jgi:hypothetical protein
MLLFALKERPWSQIQTKVCSIRSTNLERKYNIKIRERSSEYTTPGLVSGKHQIWIPASCKPFFLSPEFNKELGKFEPPKP